MVLILEIKSGLKHLQDAVPTCPQLARQRQSILNNIKNVKVTLSLCLLRLNHKSDIDVGEEGLYPTKGHSCFLRSNSTATGCRLTKGPYLYNK